MTMTATGATVVAYAVFVGARHESSSGRRRAWRTAGVMAGVALGLAMAAIQLMPLAAAVRDSWRPFGASRDFWSLLPLSTLELLSPHLFGDYFEVNTFTQLPWMAPLNSGRDPFFYSIYLGPALASLAVFGALAGWRRAWSGFWATAGTLALLLAFGPHTPVYPFVRDHVPLVGSFRYPVKYLLVLSIALSALAAGGWDALAGDERRVNAARRFQWARMSAVVLAVIIATVAYGLAGACVYFPESAGGASARLAAYVGVWDPADGAAYLLRTLPSAASRVMLFSLAAALFVAVAATRRREAGLARTTLYVLIVVELAVAAWGLNPTFDARHFREPGWISALNGDPNARYYFGGKVNGTVTMQDIDGPESFIRPFDLDPLEGRSALAAQLAFYPGGWRIREWLSYDMAALWPRPFETAAIRFRQADREARDRFLWRTGVRYRMLPTSIGGDRPSTAVEYFTSVRFYDWGPVSPRVQIVPDAMVVPDVREQITLLFSASFDPAKTVALTSPAGNAWGRPGKPAQPAARIVEESANRVTIEAGAPASGAYLLLIDSYSPDWHVTVDGVPATLHRANALFRVVRLAPGRHTVEFRYLPQSFVIGAAVSASALLLCILLAFVDRRHRSVGWSGQ